MSEELSSKQRYTVNKINNIYALARQNPLWTAVITDVRKPPMNFEIMTSINWNSTHIYTPLCHLLQYQKYLSIYWGIRRQYYKYTT